jgi:CRP/FNR family transcriptional regulator, cyclic AMP receptor protein
MGRQNRRALSLHDDPFFLGMSGEAVGRIEAFVYHREYEARQIVYFPDDECDFVYWVRSGRIKVTRVSGDGRELAFRHLIPGDMLGEECLVPRNRRYDYAEAMLPSLLCLMRVDDFRRAVREEAELCYRIAERLCRRIVDTEQVLSDTVFTPVRGRVAATLMRLYHLEQAHGGATLRVTHQELANLTGSTRETTTAVLHGLQTDGLIELANRRITIHDPGALERLARNG